MDGFGIAILWFSDGPAFRRRKKSLEKLGCGNKLCKGSSIHTPTKVVELSSPLSPIFIHFSFGYLDFFEAILLFRCEKKSLLGLHAGVSGWRHRFSNVRPLPRQHHFGGVLGRRRTNLLVRRKKGSGDLTYGNGRKTKAKTGKN